MKVKDIQIGRDYAVAPELVQVTVRNTKCGQVISIEDNTVLVGFRSPMIYDGWELFADPSGKCELEFPARCLLRPWEEVTAQRKADKEKRRQDKEVQLAIGELMPMLVAALAAKGIDESDCNCTGGTWQNDGEVPCAQLQLTHGGLLAVIEALEKDDLGDGDTISKLLGESR